MKSKIKQKNLKAFANRDSLEILGQNWEIVLKDNLTFENQKANGLCDNKQKTIFLNPNNPNIVQSFLHEVQHLIDFEFSPVLRALDYSKIKYFDEIKAETISLIWLSVFKFLSGSNSNKLTTGGIKKNGYKRRIR